MHSLREARQCLKMAELCREEHDAEAGVPGSATGPGRRMGARREPGADASGRHFCAHGRPRRHHVRPGVLAFLLSLQAAFASALQCLSCTGALEALPHLCAWFLPLLTALALGSTECSDTLRP